MAPDVPPHSNSLPHGGERTSKTVSRVGSDLVQRRGGQRIHGFNLVGMVILVLLVCSRGQAGEKLFDERRAHIASMSVAEKEHLRRNYERFLGLDEGERQNLRDLHAKIATGSEKERLSSVMRLYHQWLRSLTAGERLPLLELPADQRVRAIKKLIERQERDRFQSPGAHCPGPRR